MAGYFTGDHFDLLNKWQGQKRDESIPEQNRAYEELKKAYEVTESWAQEIKARLFPTGLIKVRKRPTSQANTFLPYNWARIYPSPDSPKELAYTVGIGANEGFVVKIDTVGLGGLEPVRRAYETVRGVYDDSSPIVAMLPAAKGLDKSFAELVEWSVDAIRQFDLRYDEVLSRIGLDKPLSDEDLLKHFDGKPAFKTFRTSWSPEDRAVFCRLARAVHAAGLDWWHSGRSIQVRFGRKNPGSERAVGVLGIVRGTGTRKISLARPLGVVGKLNREPLTDELVARVETALTASRDSLEDWLVLDGERPGMWPDQLRDDTAESDDDAGEEPETNGVARRPINRIYYGPPGTGKTYELSKLLKREYEQAMTTVSDEEWRNQIINDRIANLTWWEGTAAALHDLGGRARVGQLFEHPFVRTIAAAKARNQNVRQTLWGTLQHHSVEDSSTVKLKVRLAPAVFDKSVDSVWHFAGDWREACADLLEVVKEYRAGAPTSGAVQRYSFVTFHQSPTATRNSSRGCGRCSMATQSQGRSGTRFGRACSRSCAAKRGWRRSSDSRWSSTRSIAATSARSSVN